MNIEVGDKLTFKGSTVEVIEKPTVGSSLYRVRYAGTDNAFYVPEGRLLGNKSPEYTRESNVGPSIEDQIIDILKTAPSTDDELEQRLNAVHQTISAVMSRLRRTGIVKPVGKRATRTGRLAGVNHLATVTV